jgi:phosphopantothenoylcysteine decarboxylase / phosphopantothenate---cysteine ligase
VKHPLQVVVGITGGIAAYKAVGVIRALVLEGHRVQVVATEAALRFVGKPTLEAISRNPVETELYEGVAEVRHVAIGQAADLIVIAPATANTIAKLAVGLADDLLGNTVLASSAPLVIAPAMHTGMWENQATVANIATLRGRGVTVVGPAVGQLTGEDSGAGRMEEPEAIVAAALAVVKKKRGGRRGAESVMDDSSRHDLEGRRFVITAGGTREPLDPVRFLGNRSTGRQGIALAQAASDRGAQVTLIAANLEVETPSGIDVVAVGSTSELRDRTTEAAEHADVVIMAAAVADFRPAEVRDAKIKKTETGETLTLELVKNPDILAGLAAAKRPGQIVVGFAAETESDPSRLLEVGREKLAAKGCDFLVLNSVGWNKGFAEERNDVVMLKSGGDIVMEARGSKLSVAGRILDVIA